HADHRDLPSFPTRRSSDLRRRRTRKRTPAKPGRRRCDGRQRSYRRAALMPVRRLLVCVRRAQDGRLIPPASHELEANGQTFAGEPARDAYRGHTQEVERVREPYEVEGDLEVTFLDGPSGYRGCRR